MKRGLVSTTDLLQETLDLCSAARDVKLSRGGRSLNEWLDSLEETFDAINAQVTRIEKLMFPTDFTTVENAPKRRKRPTGVRRELAMGIKSQGT